METIQMIQQLAPAPVLVTLLALPWFAVALMHAMSARNHNQFALDNSWTARADAALRWTRTAVEPVRQTRQKTGAVLNFGPSRATTARKSPGSTIDLHELHAA